jgi:hypothetical protein
MVVVAQSQMAATSTGCVEAIRDALPAIESLQAKDRPRRVLSVVGSACTLVDPSLRELALSAARSKEPARALALARCDSPCAHSALAMSPALERDLDRATYQFAVLLARDFERIGILREIGDRLIGDLILGTALSRRYR